LSLSTANLYSAVQPGGSLYGLQHSNPVDTRVAYEGPAANFGAPNDPMVGHRIGGVNVFGEGLALYSAAHVLIGAVGVSGDSSCADHNIAWRTRNTLDLDHVPAGVSGDPSRPDTIVYDITPQPGQQEGVSAGGWGHPVCSAAATTITGTPGPAGALSFVPAGPAQNKDNDCTKEIEECSEMSADAQSDPDLRKVYGGSMTQRMKNCLPERCRGRADMGGAISRGRGA
jgi:hypothetical protein